MKRIILIEPFLSGHHETYLKHFTLTLLRLGYDVTVLCTKAPSFLQSGKAQFIDIVYKDQITLPKNIFLKVIAIFINYIISLQNLKEIKKKTKMISKNSILFYCCIDAYMNELIFAKQFDSYNRFSWSGLLLNVPQKKGRKILNRYAILKSSKCIGIGILTKSVQNKLPLTCRQVDFPDFADDSTPNINYEIAADVINLAAGRTIVALLGEISKRKGIYTFINAANQLPKNEYFFLIAGGVSESLTKDDYSFIQDNFACKVNCFFYDKRIPAERDFNQMVSVSDIIYAVYVDFYQSSNMLSKASLYNKPLLVSKNCYMEEQVKKYNLGTSINSSSTGECVCAIKYHKTNSNLKSADCSGYLKSNILDCLSQSFTEIFS